MSLIRETVNINGQAFIHVYSNDGKKVIIDGIEYDDVYDVIEHTYAESSTVIERGEEDIIKAKLTIYDKVHSYLIAKRDEALLTTTKALYQAIIDLFDGG